MLWSTYPIATAHLVALTLHRLTGIPWVADFRDSMVDSGYPPPGLQRRIFQRLERRTVAACQRVVVTTPGTRALYRQRYPQLGDGHWTVIANGYDEASFQRAEQLPAANSQREGIKLVHSGLLHPSERDPRPFLTALLRLREQGVLTTTSLRIVLRSSGHQAYYRALVERLGLEDLVELAPGLPYVQALGEMLDADGLLVFQAASCNHQIPAKLYEYLRARRPIFALTDPAGDTAGLLGACGITTLAPLDDPQAIAVQLRRFLVLLDQGRAPVAGAEQLAGFSRQGQSQQLARLLESLAG